MLPPPQVVSAGVVPNLVDVSETLLWALHNRAGEAGRVDGVLTDPNSLCIHAGIDYDFFGHFGAPRGSLAVRAAAIDLALMGWLERHPDGVVVSLGEGLETQVHRVDNGRMRWISVDLPDAIRLREHFMPPTERFHHFSGSVFDSAWMDAVDSSSGVFIIAQGLLMYLEPEKVRDLFRNIADRFPSSEMVFDTIPPWFSQMTLMGIHQTPRYRLPPMPWGICRDELEPTLKSWSPNVAEVGFLPYCVPRGLLLLLTQFAYYLPFARHAVPSLVHITMGAAQISSGRNDQRNLISEPRKQKMNETTDDTHGAETLSDMLAGASRSVSNTRALAVDSSQIVTKRVALWMMAAMDPREANHAEFARMIPEKIEAFSAAGMIVIKQVNEANQRMKRMVADEAVATAHASIAMASCSSLTALIAAQGRFVQSWYQPSHDELHHHWNVSAECSECRNDASTQDRCRQYRTTGLLTFAQSISSRDTCV